MHMDDFIAAVIFDAAPFGSKASQPKITTVTDFNLQTKVDNLARVR